MSEADLVNAIKSAIGAHGQWKLRLKVAVASGKCDIAPSVASCDDRCDFGRLLFSGSIPPEVRSSIPYIVIRRLHAEFHTCAGQVVRHAIDGESSKAETLLENDFTQRSEKLKRGLMKWLGEVR